ncbi:MAG: aminotransferase class I/II-fold pyridoxal phosphate-dependent enzyme [Promethearchaeota archaeon]
MEKQPKPINMGLNDGIYCPEKLFEVMKNSTERTSLRHYSTPGNDLMVTAIAKANNIPKENIHVAWGSGPVLKQLIPYILKKQIKSSFIRILKHLFLRKGYPVVTPDFTYTKVPIGAEKRNLPVIYLPIKPEDNFHLDVALLDKTLKKQPCLVYIATPNNPTGQPVVTVDEMIPLIEKYNDTMFFMDEAYVEYLDENEHKYFTTLVPKYPNLFTSRTFSFAYGMASAKVGYLVSSKEIVEYMDSQFTNYRIGLLQEKLVCAALEDKEHLPWVRKKTLEAIEYFQNELKMYPNMEIYPSITHYFLGKFTDGKTSAIKFVDEMMKEGIRIKKFTENVGCDPQKYFRITMGTPDENRKCVEAKQRVMLRISPHFQVLQPIPIAK